MGDLERPFNGQGEIERFGASAQLDHALTANFTERGEKAATLLVATLTETPYRPVIDGREFGVEVSNVYVGFGEETEGETPDTVEEAAAALQEFVAADIPGAKGIKLDSFKTRYERILRQLVPSRTTPKDKVTAFKDGFVFSAREKGVHIYGADEGFSIIRSAPKWLAGLRLDDRRSRSRFETETHSVVTQDGRIVTVWSDYGLYLGDHYYMSSDPSDLYRRGGKAPGSTIVRTIGDRVTSLRTDSTKR